MFLFFFFSQTCYLRKKYSTGGLAAHVLKPPTVLSCSDAVSHKISMSLHACGAGAGAASEGLWVCLPATAAPPQDISCMKTMATALQWAPVRWKGLRFKREKILFYAGLSYKEYWLRDAVYLGSCLFVQFCCLVLVPALFWGHSSINGMIEVSPDETSSGRVWNSQELESSQGTQPLMFAFPEIRTFPWVPLHFVVHKNMPLWPEYVKSSPLNKPWGWTGENGLVPSGFNPHTGANIEVVSHDPIKQITVGSCLIVYVMDSESTHYRALV